MENELKNTDILDIEDLILKAEKSFGIKFHEAELSHVKNFGEFCDYVIDKIPFEDIQTCTSQQAFYKLKNAILNNQDVSSDLITPTSKLEQIFPKENRRSRIREIENKLGFKLSILEPPRWVTIFLVVLLCVSFAYIFLNFKLGIISFALSIAAMQISIKNGNNFKVKTLREVVEKMIRENYLNSRRNSNSVNKHEIENILTNWFKDDLPVDRLNRESTFN